jgi:hypothetical protein
VDKFNPEIMTKQIQILSRIEGGAQAIQLDDGRSRKDIWIVLLAV